MASVDLEYNQGFKIYNANGTRFNNLVLHKATYETVVMSLGDKISGIVYYKNNKLVVDMTEYIMYKGVKYVLVNPPTVIKEGLVSDNGELKGMTKYSFTFYHPMYMLSNFTFSDVAVDDSQKQYLSQNKTFSWIGNLVDYKDKLNKNLEGTQWKVSIGTNVTDAEKNKLSEVLSFDNNTIADALKTAYETWEIPYIVDKVEAGTQDYLNGKLFVVQFGLPSNEIYKKDKNGNFILDDNNQKIPFVFKYGQGVGLKNNSRTPKNNKIVTRIAGYGSEDNIPYGYPQIVWTGESSWNYTINNASGMQTITVGGRTIQAMSYPIYDGIVGGQKVRLIKHPFTRTHLMPPIYKETVNKKVNPNATGYNPDIELVDYYDANGNTYPNQIKAGEPSYEIHEFEDIKPEFGSFSIDSATPYDGHSDESITQNKFLSIVDDLYTETDVKAEKTQLNALRTSFVTQQQNSAKGTSGNYEYDWSFKTDGLYKKVKYASSGANFEYVVNVGLTPATIDWDDTMDEQGNYVQSYFKVTIPALGFDLYASAAITQEMTINMRSGACIGCSFPVMVDWDDYKRNFYDKDGNFAPTGTQRNYTKYPNSTNASITLILQKETNTFGTLMPNIYQKPARGNKFVILGISLPTSYITTAERKLETEMKKYMRDNNVYYYEYPLKFDEHFLISNEHILSQMKPNVIVNFEYADVEQSLYIKQMSIKYNESPLPKYDITLTDDVDVVLNKIGEAIAEYRGQRQYGNGGGNSETLDGNKFLRKDINDTASGTIRMLKGLQVGERFVTGLLGEGGIFRKDDDGTTYLECDRMYVRMKAYFDTVEVRRFIHSGGNRVASAAGIKCSRVEYYTQNNLTTNDASEAAYFRCYFRANDNGTEITNDFEINDLAYCKETNKVGEQANTTNAVATRSVSSNRSVSEENITISLVITNNTNASVTLDGEARLVLSNPDVDGTYHGWNGSYNRTDRIVFSNNAVTLAVGESRTVTLSGELYRRSPAGDNALAEAGSRSNVILYVGGVSEVVLCSKLSSSIVFQNGGTYNVSLAQGGQGISQRFYWRKVIGVSSAVTLDGEHYIDLSATDCATGSDVPIAQDDIIQLGNTIDATRQGAIIEFVSGEDAPSYQIYQGINTYNLDNKNYIGLGYSSQTGHAYMNVYGDMFIGAKPNPTTGESSTYIKYVQEDEKTGEPRLKIKAEVEFIHSDGQGGTESTTMDDFIDAIKQSIDDIQDQIDGSIDTWYYEGAPTLNNLPASQWTTDELKHEHIGDLYYDKESGNAYRFIYDTTVEPNEYKWIQLHDDAISEALRLAAEAKDTADNKRRVFLTQPTPPYDQGDLWVNAVWPTSGEHQGETYNNEILKCVTAKTDQQTFSISDWSVANGYTAALNNFLTNTYAPFISNIQGQVDQKAETWYQDSNPATAWYDATQTPVYDVRAKHVGDIWMDTSANGGKQTYIYQYNTSTANYEWKAQAVPNEVFDYADGKCAIYVNNPTNAQNPYPTNYHEKDMWILPIDGTHDTYTIGGVEFKAGEVLFSSADSTSFVAAHWSKKLRYTGDERIDGFINQILNGTGASGDDATVANAISSIKGALNEGTLIDGGLVLTSVLGLRSNSRVWAGISGMYNTSETGTGYKGHGIAAWYGGGMADWEVYLDTLTQEQRQSATITDAYAKSLFRFDGSGYLAGGNITWDAQGRVAIKDITTLVGGNNTDILNALATFNSAFRFTTSPTQSSTILNINPQYAFSHLEIYDKNGNHAVATTDYVNENFVTKAFFNRLFQAYSSTTTTDANKVSPNEATAINNLKILVGAWTDQYLSAKGINPQQSGGGGSATLEGLDDVAITNPVAGQTLVYRNYHWVNENITSGTVTGITLGTTPYSPNNGVVTLPAYPTKSSWDYDDRYYISNGVIHLGSNTITPLTSFTETDPTVPSWAKASTKPSYAWDEITSKPTTFTPPTASSTVLGGVKIGTTMEISSGVINQKSGIVTAATYKSVTVDTYGRVTAGTNPTTLAGYGITDAVKGSTTWWGRSIVAGTGNNPDTVSGDLSSVGDISFSSSGKNIGGLMYFDTTNGRVGIGVGSRVGSPSDELHVNGNLRIEASTGTYVRIRPHYTSGVTPNFAMNVYNSITSETYRLLGMSLLAKSEHATPIFDIGYFSYRHHTNIYGVNVRLYSCNDNGDWIQTLGTTKAGNVIVGYSSGYRSDSLLSVNGDIFTNRIYFYRPTENSDEGAIYVEKVTVNNVNYLKVNGNFYATGSVSALGANTGSGGGGGVGDVTWDLLASEATNNRAIHQSYIQDALTSLGYATQSWVTLQGFLKSIPTASSDNKGGVKVGNTLAISSEVLNLKRGVATAGTYYKATVDTYGRVTGGSTSLAASDIPDISATYATSTRVSTLEGNFTGDVAKSALKLSDNTARTAWGQTFFNNGVPVSISNTYMSGVTKIDDILYFNNSFVGIGTDSPEYKLHVDTDDSGVVFSTNDYKLRLAPQTSANTASMMLYWPAKSSWFQFFSLDTSVASSGTSNILAFGYSPIRHNTEIYGANVRLYSMDDSNNWIRTLGTSKTGHVIIGYDTGYRSDCLLNVNGNMYAQKIYLYKPNKSDESGAVYFYYDRQNQCVMLNGNFAAIGAVSALGANSQSGGGGGGDVTWTSLADTTNTNQIAKSHLTDALSGYLTSHQTIYSLTIKGNSTNAVVYAPEIQSSSLNIIGNNGISVSASASNGTITISGQSTSYTVWGKTINSSSTTATGNMTGVTNINSLLYLTGARNAENVGIGTDSPTQKLDVNGNAKINGSISSVTNINSVLYFAFIGTSYSIGIGTNDPDEKLHVNGNVKIRGTLTGATSIDGLMHFDTTNNYVGIGVSSPSSALDVNGKITINNENGYAIEAYGQLRFNASTDSANHPQRVILGCFTETYQPFIRFKGSDGTVREVLNYNPSNELLLGDNTKATYVRGANTNIYSKATDSTSLVMAIKCYSGGRVGIGDITASYLGTVPSSYTGSKLIVRGDEYVDGSLAIGSKIYLYRDSSNSSNDIYFEKVTENGVNFVKLNGNFYATGAVSALGANSGSGGGGAGDVTWDLLASSSDTNQIAASHLDVLRGYATASGLSTANDNISALQDCFTNGVANSAAKLSDATAKTAWGQKFFTGGTPTSISNAPLSGVTNINSLLYFNTATANTQTKFSSNNTLVQFTRGNGTFTPKLYVDGYAGFNGEIYANGLDLVGSNASGNVHGGYIDFHYNASTADFTTRIIESANGVISVTKSGSTSFDITGLIIGNSRSGDYIQIGAIRIVYDNTDNKNALKVVGSDGTSAANFYATGSVSALGAETGGGGSTVDFSAIVNSLNQSSTAVGTGFLYSNGGAWSFQSTSLFWKTTDFTLKTASSYSIQSLGWTDNVGDNARVVTATKLAYWNGLYDDNSTSSDIHSNLAYCNRGAFGTIVTKNAGDYVALDSNNNATVSGTLYLNQNSSNYIYGSTTQSGAYYMTLHGYSGVNIESNLWVDTRASIGAEPNSNYTLYVNGTSYFSGTVYIDNQNGSSDVYLRRYSTQGGGILDMYCPAGARLNGTTTVTSDIRLKNIVSFIDTLTIDKIALAPIFNYKWKSNPNGLEFVGTSAQYWKLALPNAVMDFDDVLSLDYGATALASAVITARKVLEHEGRIRLLEIENQALRKEIEQLKKAA